MEQIVIEKVKSFFPELEIGLNNLLTQLVENPKKLNREEIETIIQSNSTFLFVAKDGEKVVGTVTIVVYQMPEFKKAMMEDLIVDAKYRGKGIGKLLMNAAIEQAKSEKVEFIFLTSRESREAANVLYQKLGFEKRETNVYRKNL